MKRSYIFILFMALSSFALAQESSCSDGVDNDGDGFIDCFDGDCANNAACDQSYIGKDKLCQNPPAGTLNFGMKLGATSRNKTTLSYGRMAVGDLDRDGTPEMVTTHHNDKKVYILNGDDLSIKTEINTIGNPEYFDHAIANLDDDNCAEIFIVETEVRRDCDSRGRNCQNNTYYMVTSFDCNGNQLWRTQAYDQPFTIGLADFDHDGKVELYYKNEILDAKTGEVLIAGKNSWNSYDSGPVAVDILPDGDCAECTGLELVLGGEIFAVDLNPRTPGGGSVGTAIKKFNDLPGLGGIVYYPKYVTFGYVNSMTSIADYNLDGHLDVIMNGATSASATSTTTVFFWDVYNNQFKTYQPRQPDNTSWPHGTGRINLADIDGDGKMNATFVSGARIYALKEDFTLLWQKTITEQTSGFTSTTVFDFNNDNAVEIVYRDEANLYIIDGKTGNAFTTIPCRSRTANDYPIVVDVDADGATEICVSCATNDNVNINNNGNTPYGQIRTFKSSLEPWVSARKVWNQYAYFNVNVNDDLTIPQVQQKHHLVFSKDVCGTGENRALNSFLNQSAILDSKGCKTYPSADVTFVANPSLLNFVPPTCPEKDFLVSFSLKNIGDLDLNGNFPITFYNGDPRIAGAVKISTQVIPFNNFRIGDQIEVQDIVVKGTGGSFTLFAVLNDNGSTVPTPISLPNSGFDECNFSNNIVSVSVNPYAFPLSASSTDHVQCGIAPSSPNGSVKAFKPEGATEQTIGYTFYWFNGNAAGPPASADYTGSVKTGLTNGTYSVYALHDAFQCGSDTVQVSVGLQDKTISATVKVDQPYTNCNDPDGQLSVTPDGGLPLSNYRFEWFEGTVFGTSPTLSDSSVLRFTKPLTYSVLITEISSNCETLESGTVPDLTVSPVVTTSFTAANCNPSNSGAASAVVDGVTAGYRFYWFNGSTAKPTEDFLGHTYPNLVAGNYTVIAEDNATGCSSGETVVMVGAAAGIAVTASATAQQTSCGLPNGVASANVGGSTTGYTFRWFEGNNTITEIGTGAVITGLAAGDYTVLATNSTTGCTDTEVVRIVDDIHIPTVTASLVSHQTACFPQNGAVRATGTASSGPYIYYWFNGNVGAPDTTTSNFKGADYSGLAAGSYTVVAVDVNTRCASARGLVQVLNNTAPPVTASSVTPQTSCNALTPNGAASANVGGSIAGYKFRWFSGADTTTFITQSPGIVNRVAGTYTVKAVNLSTGCFSTKQVTIINNFVTPVVNAAVDQNVTVCNASNGQVSAHVAGVTAGFDFYWFNGNPASPDTTAANFEGPVYTGRPVGSFTVVAVSKATRCLSAKRTVNVADNTIPPVIAAIPVNQTSCNTLTPNGQVSASVGGSTAGYKFRWFSGADTTTFITQSPGIINRVAGTYTVKAVSLATGCSSTSQVTIINSFVTPVVTAVVDQNLTVCNASNGQVSAHVAGVTSGFDFYWFNGNPALTDTTAANFEGPVYTGRPVGSFTVVAVSKATRCASAKSTVNVADNTVPPVVMASSPNDNTACLPANSNGSISANVGGVTTDHTFHIFKGQNTNPVNEVTGSPSATLSNLAAGIYTVQAIDNATGCRSTMEVTVNNNIVLPVLNATSVNVTDCSPSNGSITATVDIGLAADYTFTWYNGNGLKAATDFPGESSATLTGLVAGNYTVSAFNDLLGCDVQAPAVVEVIKDPSTDIIIIDILVDKIPGADCNDNNGQLGAQASSPVNTSGFAFSWYAGDKNSGMTFVGNGAMVTPTHSRLSGIASGRYTVIASDIDTGCQDSLVIDLPYVDEAALLSIDTSPQITCGVPDGSFEATIFPGANATGLGATQASYRLDVFRDGMLVTSVPGADPAPTVVSGLPAGSYTVVAVEIDPVLPGCASTPNDLTIDDATMPPVLIAANSDNKNCFGATANGAVSLDVDSGADPSDYTFDWRPGQLISGTALPAANVPAPGNAAVDIGEGFYTVEVTNTLTGCETVETFHINNDPYVVSILNGDLDIAHQTDCSPVNGLAEVIDTQVDGAPAGLPGFTFEWFESDGTSVIPSSGATALLGTQLGFGNYFVRVTNTLSNCQSSLKAFEIEDQTAPPLIAATATVNNSNCNGSTPNGSLTIEINGGLDPIGNFLIEWFEGEGTTVVLGTNAGSTSGLNGETAQELPAGTYTVRVTDNTSPANSCVAITSFTITDDLPIISIDNPDIAITHQTDCAPANGSAEVTDMLVNGVGTGSTAGFTYEWLESDGITAIAGSGNGAVIGVALAAGNYFIRATSAASSCSSSITAFRVDDVHVDPAIALATNISNSVCPGSTANGSLTVEINGAGDPIGDFLIEWFEGVGTTVILGTNVGSTSGVNGETAQELPAGTYTVRVTDNTSPGNSCLSITSFTIVDDLPVISIDNPDIAITHQTDCAPVNGSAEVTDMLVNGVGTGSTAGFTFEWFESDGVTVIAGSGSGSVIGTALSAGDYFVRAVSAASGCISPVTSFTVNDIHVDPTISLTAMVSNSNCTGSAPNGMLTIGISGGVDPVGDFLIEWFEGTGTAVALGSSVGSASGLNGETALGLSAGTYTVRVTDNTSPGNNCVAIGSFTITDDFPVISIDNPDIAVTHQTDCVPGNGSATVAQAMVNGIGTGNVAGYTFEWLQADGITAIPGAGAGSTVGVTLAPGNYFVRATSAVSNCFSTPTSFSVLDKTELPGADIVLVNTNIACNTNFTGQLSGSVTEGTTSGITAGYVFDWFSGKNNTNPGDFVSGGTVLPNLQEGDYTLRVSDISAPGLGCTATASLAVAFDPTQISSVMTSVMQVSCTPSMDGAVAVNTITETVAGISTTYAMANAADRTRFDFQWFDESLIALPVTPAPVNGLNAISNLTAGQYYVRVTNNIGCSATLASAIVEDLTVPPVITLENFQNPAVCIMPETSGFLQVSADHSLNFGDYTFEWFEGADASGTVVAANNATLANIHYDQPLEYTVRVTNMATNCSNLDTYRFKVDTVNIHVLASAVARTSCLVDDGSLFATTLEGAGSQFHYEWYQGSAATGTPVFATKQVANVPMGIYTVVAVNPNHEFCSSAPYTTRVGDGRIIPAVVATQKHPLTYCDPANPNGVAWASVNNAADGFAFDWFAGSVAGSAVYTGSEASGLAAATYVVRATDAISGCEGTASIVIDNNPVNVPAPTVIVVSHHTNCLHPDGVLSVSVNGNTSDYFLQWYDGNSAKNQHDGTGEFYRNLKAGFYTATAMDITSGCVSGPVTAEILPFQENPEFDITTVPTNCEQNIGEATLTLLNNVQLLSVEWDIDGAIQFGTMLSDLPKGEFTVTATTYQECVTSRTFVIDPEVLVFNGVSRNNDGHNDIFEIACIQDFPQNNVKIFNRAGTLVYEATGYDNQAVLFDGVSNRGINLLGTDLPDGTYFYIIDKGNGSEPRTGYLELLR